MKSLMSHAASGSVKHIKDLLGSQNDTTMLLITELPKVTWWIIEEWIAWIAISERNFSNNVQNSPFAFPVLFGYFQPTCFKQQGLHKDTLYNK